MASKETESSLEDALDHHEAELPAITSPAYSVFTPYQKRLIVFLVTFAATFSPISSFIFFPTITALSRDLRVSIEKINVTVTSYMIVAGVAPAILGDMADMTGRRIVYLLTLAIYCAANVGLAFQSDWAALFVLRMVQSAGGAATIAIGYGTVSDIAAPAERGGYVGILLLGPNVATAIGPVIGGVLTQHPSWRWTFWFLAITSAACLGLVALLLPETSRYIVGNGSQPVHGIHRSTISFFVQKRLQRQKTDHIEGQTAVEARSNRSPSKPFHVPNPLTSLKILFAKDAIMITLIYGVFYMNFSCLQASLSTLVLRLYTYSELEAGLLYLPFGVGSIAGAYSSGLIMDRDYKIIARKNNLTIDKRSGDDLRTFPIQKARYRSVWWFIGLTGLCTIGYGWSLQARAYISIPLVLQFIIGGAIAITFNMSGTLLTDLHPKSPAAAQAANNIVRCSLAGAGLAVLEPLLNSIDVGWTFTLFGGVSLSCLVFAWAEWRYGKQWDEAKRSEGKER